MRRIQTSEAEAVGLFISRSYDAVPRDGPAVFVANDQIFDPREPFVGAWIDAARNPDQVAAGIELVTGRAWRLGGWSIVDQVELGPVAVDQDCPPAQISQLGQAAIALEAAL